MIYRSEDSADQRGGHHQNTQFIWGPISVPYTIDFSLRGRWKYFISFLVLFWELSLIGVHILYDGALYFN